MTRRKGELTAGAIDREWPHQVALPADKMAGKNYAITYDFWNRKISNSGNAAT
jgi:hypothetical protein